MLFPFSVLLRLEYSVRHVVCGVQIAGDNHIAEDGQVGKQADILEGPADAKLGYPMGCAAGDVCTVEDDLAAIRRINAGDVVEDGGLARAVWANQAMDFTRLQRHAEIVDGSNAAEILFHIPHFKDWCCHISGPPSLQS